MSGAFTTAGTTIGISQGTEPATYDITGFDALTYVAIGEIVDGGEFGRSYELVTHNPIGTRQTVKRKGSFNDGQLTLQLARVPSDTGQAALLAALDSDLNSSFEITLQDGTTQHFIAQVLSYTTNLGNVNQITGATVVVEITDSIVETAP